MCGVLCVKQQVLPCTCTEVRALSRPSTCCASSLTDKDTAVTRLQLVCNQGPYGSGLIA